MSSGGQLHLPGISPIKPECSATAEIRGALADAETRDTESPVELLRNLHVPPRARKIRCRERRHGLPIVKQPVTRTGRLMARAIGDPNASGIVNVTMLSVFLTGTRLINSLTVPSAAARVTGFVGHSTKTFRPFHCENCYCQTLPNIHLYTQCIL